MDKFFAFVGKFFSREFLIVVATIVAVVMETGTLPAESSVYKLLSLLLAVLTALGYAAIRTVQKSKEIK